MEEIPANGPSSNWMHNYTFQSSFSLLFLSLASSPNFRENISPNQRQPSLKPYITPLIPNFSFPNISTVQSIFTHPKLRDSKKLLLEIRIPNSTIELKDPIEIKEEIEGYDHWIDFPYGDPPLFSCFGAERK